MSVLARKVSRAKWDPADGLQPGEISADAVSADLRTSDNTLSFWRCNAVRDEELRSTVLALATAAERIDRIDVAWIDESDVESEGLSQVQTAGETPVLSLRSRHVDIARLDLVRLGTVARLIAKAFSKNQHKRMTKKEVVEIIIEAVNKGLVGLRDLKPKVREEVERARIQSSGV